LVKSGALPSLAVHRFHLNSRHAGSVKLHEDSPRLATHLAILNVVLALAAARIQRDQNVRSAVRAVHVGRGVGGAVTEGEVVVVRRQGVEGRLDLKRIVAGPGATVTINGEERVLAADEWYVLGDNLNESQDSRTLGPVRTKDIVGRVWLRY